ncbi:hypothetical protein [Williamsoniiplasma luminosum]|nr:hypothetical protein [Williamsoniiplasma luminosum]
MKKTFLVSNETLIAKEMFQQEQTKLIQSLKDEFENSILDDVFSMSDAELLGITKDRFNMILDEMKSYKKYQLGGVKSQTKPYKDILNGLKKELTDTENSLSKQLDLLGEKIHSIGYTNGFESKLEAAKNGAKVHVKTQCFDISKVPEEIVTQAVEFYMHELTLKALKQGEAVPVVPGVLISVHMPTFDLQKPIVQNDNQSSNEDDGLEM